MGLLDRLRVLVGDTGWDGTTGPPRSSNGASSMHLDWLLPSGTAPATTVSATLTIPAVPAVDALYFWALQASFGDARGAVSGGAHLGLQWYGAHPGSTAVNWGGYASGGGELTGSVSTLPSATGNPNTRDLPWRAGTPYRLTIGPGPEPGSWRGSIADTSTGRTTVVRDLLGGGDRLLAPVVWSEVFADCNASSVTVRWADLAVTTTDGTALPVTRVRTSYQSRADGGCANTTSDLDGDGFVQTTNTVRRVAPGEVLDQAPSSRS